MDSHTLFIDAEGTDDQLKKAGICKAMQTNPALFLLSFVLKTFPAASRTFWRLLTTLTWTFRTSAPRKTARIINISNGIVRRRERELLVHVNLAVQTLDEQGLSPYRIFDSISKFAELLGASKGNSFMPRISTHNISDNTEITLIEPPCGIKKSNRRTSWRWTMANFGAHGFKKDDCVSS